MSKNRNFSDTSANRYSLALYELAEESKAIEEIEKNSSSIIKLISNSDEVKSLIKNPTIKKEELNIVVSKISEQYKLNSLLTKFLNFLISKRRFFYIEKILKNFIETCSKKRGEMIAQLTSAKELSGHEIDKIKSLFLDKKIEFEKLPEVLNNIHNLDFDSVRDACLGGEKENLNKNLGNVIMQNEEAYLYLNNLSRRIQKLRDLNNQYAKDKNFEKAIENLRPPIFWKDKGILLKQIKKWSPKKLIEAREILFNVEVLIKTNVSTNNNTLIKNLIINLYNKAISTS